jgi:hypothetical protein
MSWTRLPMILAAAALCLDCRPTPDLFVGRSYDGRQLVGVAKFWFDVRDQYEMELCGMVRASVADEGEGTLGGCAILERSHDRLVGEGWRADRCGDDACGIFLNDDRLIAVVAAEEGAINVAGLERQPSGALRSISLGARSRIDGAELIVYPVALGPQIRLRRYDLSQRVFDDYVNLAND